MQNKKLYIILSATILFISLFMINFSFFSFIIKILPFLIFIVPLFYTSRIIRLLNPRNKNKNLHSESIFQKRIKRFKSVKRGYYSLIVLIILYIASFIFPLWMNNKPLIVYLDNETYDSGESFVDKNNNGTYDYTESFIDENGDGKWNEGEDFTDSNKNGKWDTGEDFTDEYHYYFPAIKDFFTFTFLGEQTRYSASTFGQKNSAGTTVDFRLLSENLNKKESKSYIVMPFYIYHPHEDLSDQLDDKFIDSNKNGKWDVGEELTYDLNGDGKWTSNSPPSRPGGNHIAGIDAKGSDVFSRLIDGYRISITFAIIVSTLGYIIGIIMGACLGYFGGKLDLFGVRLIEIFSSIPFLFVLMILGVFLKPGIILLATLSVILKGWIGITMYIRGEFFREKPKDYVSAAVSMGQSNWKIMFKHILPNSLTPIITFAPFAVIADIGTLVSLDFLGYGLQAPASSWGHLLQQGSQNIGQWHLLVFPIIALTLTIFMITFISEAVREAFDPRVYSRLR